MFRTGGRSWPASPGVDDRDTALQAIVASDQVCLECRLGPAESPAPFDQGKAAQDRPQRGRSVAKPVLMQLGQLDRGLDRIPAGAGRERLPGLGGVLWPAEPAQQMGAIDGHPLRRPGGIHGRGCRGSARHQRSPRAPAEIGRSARPPPRVVVDPGAVPCAGFPCAGLPGGHSDRRRRFGLSSLHRRIETRERLAESLLPGERPGEAGQVARRSGCSSRLIAEACLEESQECRQGADVLIVVLDHVSEAFRRPATEKLEVAAGDLPAFHVSDSVEAKELRFSRPEAGVGHSMPEQPAHDREQIQVATVERGGAAGQAVARDEERPVESAPVVGHQPGIPGDHGR